MINPGGSPGTSFSKSAMTRFNNTQTDAMRRSMPFNAAAQSALRNKYSGSNAGGPPVGPQASPMELFNSPEVNNEVELPTEGPQLSEGEFNPEDHVESQIDDLLGKIGLNKFLESPRVKDVMTQIQVSSTLNPHKLTEPKDMLTQVVERLQL